MDRPNRILSAMKRPRPVHTSPRSAYLALLALAALVAGPGQVREASAEIVTANFGDNSVTVHAMTANGDAPPLARIAGSHTGLDQSLGVAVDPVHGEVLVTSRASETVSGTVRVFHLSANGNVQPLRTLGGPATLLSFPLGIAVDLENDEIVVRNIGDRGHEVLTFARTASGDAAPLRVVSGLLTEIDFEAVDLALDTVNDQVFVSSRDSGSLDAVLVFPRLATGQVAPMRKIQGAATTLTSPYGIAVDTVHDEVLVVDSAAASRILVFARAANGNVAPLRQISPSPAIAGLTGLDLDLERDEIIVASPGSSRLFAFSRTASGSTPPLRVVVGPSTGLSNPGLIAVNQAAVFGDGFESGDTSAWSLTVP